MTSTLRKTLPFILLLMAMQMAFAQKKGKKSKTTEQSAEAPYIFETNVQTLEQQAKFIDAMQMRLLGNYQDALSGFNAILKADPKNHAAAFEISRIYYDMGQFDQAEKYASTAVKLYPYIEWYHIFLAESKAERGDYYGAGLAYGTLVKFFPDETDYYYDWAFMLSKAEKHKEAIAAYDALEKKIGIHEDIIDYKLEQYLYLKENDNAIKEVRKLIASDPAEPAFQLKLGYIYLDIEEQNNAISTFQDLLKKFPANVEARMALASAYKLKGEDIKYQQELRTFFSEKAIAIDEKIQNLIPYIQEMVEDDSTDTDNLFVLELSDIILKEHPDDVKALTANADVYYMMGMQQKAIIVYKAAVAGKGATMNVWGQLITLLLEDENYAEIVEYAGKAITAFPEDAIFYFYKGVAAAQSKDFLTTANIMEEGLKKKIPTEALRGQMLTTLGDACNELKWFAKSDSAYEKALEIDPNNAYTLNNYAYYLSVRKQYLDKAEKMSKKSNLLVENNPAFLDTYAWILFQKKAYTDALKWMEKAIKAMETPSAELYDHYGDILFKLGRTEDAVSKWKTALELEPEKPGLAQKIAERKLTEE
jgi:tetratricopeptide (TPR) repeat protein